MAEWEARDPRWLVTDRSDGTNVNGWHWQDKNLLGWSKAKLAELLVGLQPDMSAAQGAAQLTALKDVTGEALLTVRKGNKRWAMFELELTLAWEGRWAPDDNQKVQGTVKVTEFSSTNDPDEYLIEFAAEGSSNAETHLQQAMATLRPLMLERLQEYAAELAQQS